MAELFSLVFLRAARRIDRMDENNRITQLSSVEIFASRSRPAPNEASDFREHRKKSELVSFSAILNEIKMFSDLAIKNTWSEPTVETMFDRRKSARSTAPARSSYRSST
jgi:hypothetical protein